MLEALALWVPIILLQVPASDGRVVYTSISGEPSASKETCEADAVNKGMPYYVQVLLPQGYGFLGAYCVQTGASNMVDHNKPLVQ